MKAKVSELSNKLYWIQDDSTTLEHIEAFNNCTTTLSELKEMWEDAKIIKYCVENYPSEYQLVAFSILKKSPQKFTVNDIQEVVEIAQECEHKQGKLIFIYNKISEIIDELTKLPPNGIEVEIEGNKIVKVYV